MLLDYAYLSHTHVEAWKYVAEALLDVDDELADIHAEEERLKKEIAMLQGEKVSAKVYSSKLEQRVCARACVSVFTFRNPNLLLGESQGDQQRKILPLKTKYLK